MSKTRLLLIMAIYLMVLPNVIAQEGEGVVPINVETEHVSITWPPPSSEVWSVGDVLGTADIPNMAYYYLEYIGLSEDLQIPDNAPWIPVTAALTDPVIDGSLATLDTTTVPDGVYALRLTVNTEDNQQYHDVVSPVRVSNERFERIFAALGQADEAEDEATEAEVVEPPQDNLPRVTPSGVAVNVRRCDIVDNDRCPAIDSLERNTFGEVTGINRAGTWYQIRTPHSAVGWVARTVIEESGDFANVPVRVPPQPLPPRPVQPIQPTPTTAIPTGMSVDGAATCGQTFNVLVNIGNVGNTRTPAGTITLQDVSVRTGDVTHTSYGNFPEINPGQNFVVRIPVQTSVYYNEEHELRAFANGRQFSVRYTLQQGTCGVANAQPPQVTSRQFAQGECRVGLATDTAAYGRPGGAQTFTAMPGEYAAISVQTVGNLRWYQINFADAPIWVVSTGQFQFNGTCAP